jgi:hypothetical protein
MSKLLIGLAVLFFGLIIATAAIPQTEALRSVGTEKGVTIWSSHDVRQFGKTHTLVAHAHGFDPKTIKTQIVTKAPGDSWTVVKTCPGKTCVFKHKYEEKDIGTWFYQAQVLVGNQIVDQTSGTKDFEITE